MNLRYVSIAVCAALFAGSIGYSIFGKQSGGGSINLNKQIITGVITSEKENFFKDERVKQIFEDNNIEVQYTRMTSSQIADAKSVTDIHNSMFVFPSGIQTTEKVKSNFKNSQSYNIFYSPMVIATWTPIVNILQSNDLVKKQQGFQYLDLTKFMQLVENNTRWKDLKNSSAYSVNKVALISSTDSRYSNAAKMYVALNSYILNNNNVVTNNQEVEAVMPNLKKIILAQGNRESSSTNMMSDYMSIGMGKVPMMFAYESEYLENAFKNKGVKSNMQLLYPSPTVFTKHVITVLDPKAQVIVDLLQKDKELKNIANEYGFRMEGDNSIVAKAKSININIPETIIDVIDPPSYDILDTMSKTIEEKN